MNINSTTSTILHLSLLSGVGPAAIKKIISAVGNSNISAIYNWSTLEFRQSGISHKCSNEIVCGLDDKKKLEQELFAAEKSNTKIISVLDSEYPELLREIHLPPSILYVQGSCVWQQQDLIAVVGARKAGNYAKTVIRSVVPECVNSGFVIASGGAIGADSMAHQEVLNHGGKTVAVLGSGLLRPYPYSNKKLFEQIVESGGALVSPFSLFSTARPGNFPARNRIISGMSLGCLVVQAAEKSGALITAYCSLDQGREVFAVPGMVDDFLSAGCHKIIQRGAKLVCCANDIFDELNAIRKFGNVQSELFILPSTTQNEKSCDNLNSLEREILDYCRHPKSADEISQVLEKDSQEIYSALIELQFDGKIDQDFSGMWQRI